MMNMRYGAGCSNFTKAGMKVYRNKNLKINNIGIEAQVHQTSVYHNQREQRRTLRKGRTTIMMQEEIKICKWYENTKRCKNKNNNCTKQTEMDTIKKWE